MSKFDKLIKDELSQTEEDKLLDEVLSAKFDAELRSRWDAQLKEQHKDMVEQGKRTRVVKLSMAWRAVAVAASIAAISFAVYLLYPSSPSAQSFAQNQLESTEIIHPGTIKGQITTETKRALAIEAFNQQNYSVAVREFNNIANPSQEDQFYHGLALLLDRDYMAAGRKLKPLLAEDSPFREEARWYLALSLVFQEKMEEAKIQLSSMTEQEWKFDQAQALLKLIP